MSNYFYRAKSRLTLVSTCTLIAVACSSAYAKAPQDAGQNKAAESKASSKSVNDKDVVLSKNSQSTLYLLSGWGKAEGPYMWFTVSAHFNKDQMSPDGKPFNLYSASGAVDCKENISFYYRTSYLFFDAKTQRLNEVFFEKNKSHPLPIDSGSVEADVKNIICK